MDAATEIIGGNPHWVESAGAFGAFIVLGVMALVVLWKQVGMPLLERVITITSQVRDVVAGTERTASILARAVSNIDPKLLESGFLNGDSSKSG